VRVSPDWDGDYRVSMMGATCVPSGDRFETALSVDCVNYNRAEAKTKKDHEEDRVPHGIPSFFDSSEAIVEVIVVMSRGRVKVWRRSRSGSLVINVAFGCNIDSNV
jgi:hypothetical protein